MVPVKYAELGFKVTEFGLRSKVLKFEEKPIFVFNALANMDSEFISQICDSYLAICGKRKDPVSIRL